MAFKIASSPHLIQHQSTTKMMTTVMLATTLGLAAQTILFGWGTIIQVLLAMVTAVICEAVIVQLRGRDPLFALRDCSAILTALLLALSIPPLAPWWIIVIGTAFSIIVAKQLYGGLGFNPFNPAMVGYVLLLISFPLEMTSWLPPLSLQVQPVTLTDCIYVIFTQFSEHGFSLGQLRATIDGATMATPLDALKTNATLGLTVSEITQMPIFAEFAGVGWLWVNLGYLVGGLYLIKQRIIGWQIPGCFLATLSLLSLIAFLAAPDNQPSPIMHLFSGATMLGAFFILTDPVSASTTVKGRLIYGALIGALVFIIRTYGGYPDAVAFAVLIANMTVPLIDYYTRPQTYGHKGGR